MAELSSNTTIGGVQAETIEGSQAKADLAEENAKNYTDDVAIQLNSDIQDVETNLENNLRSNSAKPLVVETRTSDPESPVVGQIWLRTDL